MTNEVLRFAVVVLAMLVVGSTLVIAARYTRSALRLGRSPGRILAQHVALVAFGTSGLAGGYAWGVYEGLARETSGPPAVRLWLYLLSMLVLLIGVVEVGRYQRVRARQIPDRQEHVRSAVRAALEGRPVSGPRSADTVSVHVTNAVLALEGTPPLPEPATANGGPARSPTPDDYGRHAHKRKRADPGA